MCMYPFHVALCSLSPYANSYQVWTSGRNDPSSSSFSGSSFVTNIGSNFIIGVRNTIDHEPHEPIRETFSFLFCLQRSSVTIHLIDWIDFRTFWRKPETNNLQEIMNISTENTMQGWAYAIYICVKIVHTAAFNHQCEPQKQFADPASLLLWNMREYDFCSWFKFVFVCNMPFFVNIWSAKCWLHLGCKQSLSMCRGPLSGLDLLSMLELLTVLFLTMHPTWL